MIEVKNVCKKYPKRVLSAAAGGGAGPHELVAVDHVSLVVRSGKTMGLVGESGSGKSTLGRLIAGLERPDSGEIFFEGQSSARADRALRVRFRRAVQVVFQDPMNALDPRWTVRAILEEPFRVHPGVLSGGLAVAVSRLLDDIRLPQAFLSRRPRELSGGERQRVCIARALALEPRIVICDEAVSSLDVLVRAEILNLLLDLQERRGIGYLFVSHDLAVVRHMSDDVAVMRHGKLVESGPATTVLSAPQTDYARALLDAGNLIF